MIMSTSPVHKLKYGDTIGLFSPSEPLTVERQFRMKESIRFLETKYNLIWAEHAFDNSFYQAGTRESRLSDIVSLLSNLEVKAMLATWGGQKCKSISMRITLSSF